MSLNQAKTGEPMLVVRISAEPKLRKHLENLGIVTGAELTPLALSAGNMIVRVYDSRVAIDRDLAQSINVIKRPCFA